MDVIFSERLAMMAWIVMLADAANEVIPGNMIFKIKRAEKALSDVERSSKTTVVTLHLF